MKTLKPSYQKKYYGSHVLHVRHFIKLLIFNIVGGVYNICLNYKAKMKMLTPELVCSFELLHVSRKNTTAFTCLDAKQTSALDIQYYDSARKRSLFPHRNSKFQKYYYLTSTCPVPNSDPQVFCLPTSSSYNGHRKSTTG